ncbi:MAG TPA: ATPase domain-containing protein [Herpetosiphonaceae bacterium]
MTTPREPWATGVTGLDLLLAGGLHRHALVVIVGPPGAGKTVLASQILFQAVQQNRRGLLLTLYAEDHTSLLGHLRPFAFFREPAVGETLTLLSLPSLLGLTIDTATAALMKTIRESGAQMVLIDGFQGIADQLHDVTALRRLLAALVTQLSYLDVTLLLTLTGTAREEPITMGLTSADVVLGLHYGLDGVRHTRRIEVVKQRGQAHLPGAHTYTITHTGVTITPQLEVRAPQDMQPRPTGRLTFQVAELDHVLGGGLTAGTTTLVVGAPGVGKTTLGLTWALAAEPPGTSIMLSFAERLPDLQVKADFLGLPLAAALAAETFTFLQINPVLLNPDAVAERLLAALTPTTQRVVIDNAGVLVQVLGGRTADYLTALGNHLYAAGVTTLLLVEIKAFAGLDFDVADTPLSILADNIVMVQQVVADGVLRRVLAVLKMRYSGYDATLRELVIDDQGVRVLTPAQSTTGVLADAADASGLTAPSGDSPPGA